VKDHDSGASTVPHDLIVVTSIFPIILLAMGKKRVRRRRISLDHGCRLA
jgi:hypothetical protein